MPWQKRLKELAKPTSLQGPHGDHKVETEKHSCHHSIAYTYAVDQAGGLQASLLWATCHFKSQDAEQTGTWQVL